MSSRSRQEVVLTAPPWSYAALAGRGERRGGLRRDLSGQGHLAPLGLHHLATTLELRGHRAAVLDGYRVEMAALIEDIVRRRPAVVGISVVTPLWPSAKALVSRLRSRLPAGVRIAVGGPHAGLAGGRLREEAPSVDAVFEGARELPFARWVEGAEHTDGADLEDDGPHPVGWARRLVERIPWRRYEPNLMFLGHRRFATSVTSVGCAGACAFCALGGRGGARTRPATEILEEMTHLATALGVRWLNFMDDQTVFANCDASGEALLDALARRRLPLGWTLYLDRYDLEERWFRKLAAAGCRRILLLVESGVQRVVDYVKARPVALVDVEETAVRIHRAGIQACARFQFGFPGETFQDGRESVRFALSLPLTLASFLPAMTYPGSRMARDLGAGRLEAGEEARWSYYGRPVVPDAMTLREQRRLVREGLLAFYGRLGQVERLGRSTLREPLHGRPWAIARRVLLDGVDGGGGGFSRPCDGECGP